MSPKPNPRLVGIFVVAALAIFIGTFLLINRDKFFSESSKSVLYFEGSVKGLNVGSPVVFNGVPIGRVVGISLVTDIQNLSICIPVYIEADEGSFIVLNKDGHRSKDRDELMERLLQKGLRAKLITQSVLTGQMMIELGFYPNSPMILHGNTRFPEIPTLPSTIEELSKTFQDMPIHQTVTRINSLLEQMDRFMTLLNKDGPKIVADAGETVAVLSKTTKKADKVMDSFSENSRTMIDLNKMIKDFGYAAQSIRSWADYLERHPEALIRGKGGSR